MYLSGLANKQMPCKRAYLPEFPGGAGCGDNDDAVIVRVKGLVVRVIEVRRGRGLWSAETGGPGRGSAAAGDALHLGTKSEVVTSGGETTLAIGSGAMQFKAQLL